ncbi:choice-of-anchor A family protein [Gynuella sunshinyii]|uniref:Rhs family protein n=1 Tax=Gynuella sunshinyii YC6258 TaxID=1445510 RepID=A0A0C5VTP6_9GAMM|nr:choice-of-anchor A family protein [Gynuella sunshinyii]AJQ96673.1 rhs family protein [Gynuella sunshinyii YC6258]
MTKIVALPLCILLSLVSLSSIVSAQDFGVAQPYNALVFGDFTATASDVEGRLAAGGNISLLYYSIGQQLNTTLPDGVLIAGGDITFPNGHVYNGDILAGGSTDGVDQTVIDGMAEGATVTAGADLPIDFIAVQSELTQLSADLATLDANGTVVYQWGGVYMTAACDAKAQVFQLDGGQVLAANTFSVDLSCAPVDATYIFNIDGAAPGLTNMGLQSLESVRDHVVYNFYQATSLTLQSVGVQGSVLAPLADLDNPTGVIYGQLFANHWNGPMQINQVPFVGDLPEANEPPVITSTPTVKITNGEAYLYDVEATDPDDDELHYTLLQAPEGMLINPDSGAISWHASNVNGDTVSVEVAVSDPYDHADTQSYDITIIDVENSCVPDDAVVVNFDDFIDVTTLQINGDASTVASGDNQVLRLTPSQASQAGSAFLKQAIPLVDNNGFQASFSTFFSFRISNPNGVSDPDGQGADGLTFVVQTVSSEVGSTGGGIGYKGIPTSLGIEFDTYYNRSVDPDGNHIGIDLNGDMVSKDTVHIAQRMNDGDIWYSWVDYDGATQTLEVRLSLENTRPEQAMLSYHVDLTSVLETENAYLGFTSGTGSGYGDHDILSWQFINAYTPIGTCAQPYFTSVPPQQISAYDDYGYLPRVENGSDGTYTLLNAPSDMEIDSTYGLVSWTPTNDNIGTHRITLQYSTDGGLVTEQSFPLLVTNASRSAPEITTTPDQSLKLGESFAYTPEATDPNETGLQWQLIYGPEGMSFTGGTMSWTPVEDQMGINAVAVETMDAFSLRDIQYFNIDVTSTNQVPLVDPTNDEISLQAGDVLSYQINASDPDNDELSYTLFTQIDGLIVSGSGLMSWQSSEDLAEQALVIKVGVSDGHGGSTTFQLILNIEAAEVNHTPSIVSQPTSPAIVGEEYRYDVVARDADGDTLTFALITAPDGMTLSDAGALHWTATSNQVGSHAISLSVSDGQATVTQSYTLEVVEASPDNHYPVINSHPGSTAVVDQSYRYEFSATDADGDVLTYGILTGPDGMTMDVSGLLQWTPTTDQVGSHDVVLYADDGQGRSLQSYSIAVSAEALPLSATILISPEAVNPGDTVVINVFTSGGTGSPSSTLWVDDTEVALNAYGQAEIVTSATDAGIHSVSVQVSDGTTTILEASSYSVRVPQDNNAPVVSLNAPDIDSIISAPADVIGSVSDDNLYRYRVMISPKGQQAWQTIAEGSSNVSDAKVATLDPTMLINGQYDIVLYAEDVNGHTASDSTVIGVEGDLKVGNFSITLEDLNIPMAGIPIRLTRTYDSRRRFEDLDFGYGWSVGYQDVKVEESRTIGKFWSVNQYKRGPFNLIVDFCVEPQGAPVVTITLPTGEVERFEAAASPSCSTYQVINNVDLKFNPVGDTQSTLTALDDSSAYYSGGLLLETGYFSSPVDPDRYKLTTQSGYEYYLNQDFGIDKVVDPNGNTLTYTNNGIFHSSGKAITFNRDSKGRITSITDPNGHRLDYRYDNNGNLTVSEDALDAQTTYVYNRSHGLLDLVDPLGRTLIKNIYDDNGRLIAQEDNDGQRIDFNHDIAGRESVVSDRNGHTTFYYYDDMGNVTTRIDAAGETWEYRYDEHGNQLSETDPLGNVTEATFDADNNQLTQTDALGNTITYAYNSRGQETEITDALGNVYKNTYDSIGNLLMVTDPLGNIAGNNINKKGLVSKTTDALKNVTEYTYDSDGNKLTETHILATATTATDGGSTGNAGAVTTYTYDDNGNVLTETNAAGNTTTYVYDARNRVIETHYADGSVSQNEYDLAGQLIATIDALGHRTEMDYDAYGRVTETRYPDGTWEANTYDSEGNRLSTTDRLGQMTIYHYDALNRVIQTDLADGSSTYTSYDAVGRVISETDALGHITQYEYDAAGRRTAVINALDHRHSFAYDANGNLISETDANGHTTRYDYNALDQRTQTTYADGSSESDEYDALGRRTRHTDQAGITTDYSYDALGRLISVTDTEGNVTTYGYDNAGNKTRQTDAEGRETTWTYDSQGRITSRTLPMGQQERFTYDLNGNMATHTDFNGQETRYNYDENNQLTRIEYADDEIETFSYDVLGNRTSATDSQGTTKYQYDSQSRLIQETQPNGAVLSYQYDANGNKTRFSVTRNGLTDITRYGYDQLNRLESITTNDGTTTYGYDDVGNRTSLSYPNGTSQVYNYDSLNRLTELKTYNGNGTLVEQYSYTLDKTGRRIKIEELDGRSTEYSYDTLYRLTGETITDAINGDYTATYQYDKVGNRTYETVDGVQTAYTYDANDRLTESGGISYTYDDNGNTLTQTEDGVTTSYQYNAKNELIGVSKDDGSTTASYQYNIDGIRNQKTESGSTTEYVVDSNQAYAQVVQEISNGSTIVSYAYGDDLISQVRSGSTSYYHVDGLGSTRSLSDSNGDITDTYDYEAFGELLNQTGDTENSHLYAGEAKDETLGMYNLRFRWYNPEIGRFNKMDDWAGNAADPITLHKYLYAGNDPVQNIDPGGHFFGLAGFGAASNIQVELSNLQIDIGMSFLDSALNPDTAAASVGSNFKMLGLAALGGTGFKLLSKFSRKFRKACNMNSFNGDTLVATELGLKPIQDIRIGDKVWAYDEATGEKSLQTVVHLITGEGDKEIVNITLDSGEVIEATAGHPFYVPGLHDWVNAGELTLEQSLMDLDGENVTILKLVQTTEKTKVYNLTVANDHTYYVGEYGVLAHNAGICTKVVNWKSVKSFGHTFNTHGAGVKNTQKLIDRARSTGNAQGQWLDNQRAAEFLAVMSHSVDVPTTVRITPGLGQVITKEGEVLDTVWAIIVPSKNGIKTAYPVLK